MGGGGLLHCRVEVAKHAEHVHVGDGEERQGQHQGQARQPVDVPLLSEQLRGDDPIAPEEGDRRRCDGEGGRDDGDEADEVEELLTGDVDSGLDVGEEEPGERADESDDAAQDDGVDDDRPVGGRGHDAGEDMGPVRGEGPRQDGSERQEDEEEEDEGDCCDDEDRNGVLANPGSTLRRCARRVAGGDIGRHGGSVLFDGRECAPARCASPGRGGIRFPALAGNRMGRHSRGCAAISSSKRAVSPDLAADAAAKS
ncbi:Uncharacterised protein [Chlamydia trachomatis]|nr:Uncharacterised protein [Chlamydia trachomatis]